MSGIPVYTQSPINAASKPSGVTPQTAAPPQGGALPVAPNNIPATTTSTSTSTYPPARPGAPAVPAPTGTAAQRYAPVQPTKTTSSEAQGPPAPQPGAVPTPLNRHVPPPPRAGETFHPEQYSAPASMPQPYPPQMSIPPPTTAFGQPPSSSTSTSNTASSSYPVQIPSSEAGTRRSLEHPPGYHQDVYASEQTSEQRRAQEVNNASSFGAQDSTRQEVGARDSDGSGVWDTAMKWAQQTGAKISEAEAEVWRKINKE